MAQTLPEKARQLLDAPTFATLGTVNPDGTPQLTVHWVTRDGDDILLSTTSDRQKTKNLERHPRASLLIISPENPYSYLEVRGNVEITEEGGRELIDDLAEKYIGQRPYPWDTPDAKRVVLRLTPERVVDGG